MPDIEIDLGKQLIINLGGKDYRINDPVLIINSDEYRFNPYNMMIERKLAKDQNIVEILWYKALPGTYAPLRIADKYHKNYYFSIKTNGISIRDQGLYLGQGGISYVIWPGELIIVPTEGKIWIPYVGFTKEQVLEKLQVPELRIGKSNMQHMVGKMMQYRSA